MKKIIAGLAIMAAFNDSLISAIILCALAFAFIAWIVKEAARNNIQ